MPRVTAKTLDLVVDGKVVQVKTPEKGNFELNKALTDPAKFKQFAADPAAFANQYHLKIDPAISAQLAKKLKGMGDVSNVRDILGAHDGSQVGATIWAVASGAYSCATSKIAVAF